MLNCITNWQPPTININIIFGPSTLNFDGCLHQSKGMGSKNSIVDPSFFIPQVIPQLILIKITYQSINQP